MSVTTLLFQDIDTYRYLGPWGQLLLLLLALAFAYFTWRNRAWKSAAEAASAALGVIREEMTTHKDRAERLSLETRQLLVENASLKTKTDLEPLINVITAWTEESRQHFLQAMERLEQIHGQHTRGMAEVSENLRRLNEGFHQVVAEVVKTAKEGNGQ